MPHEAKDKSDKSSGERVALLIDWENIKGAAAGLGGPPDIITLKKMARRFGKLCVARAYANWADIQHEGDMERLALQGIEPVFALTRPRIRSATVPNSADVRLACDGMDILATHPAITCFVVASGDGSLAHLLRHLSAGGKRIVRVAGKDSVTKFLYVAGEERVLYDDWIRGLQSARRTAAINEALKKLTGAVNVLSASGGTADLKLVKDKIREQDPAFEEEDLGVPSFRHLAYLAEDQNLLCIDAGQEPAVAYPPEAAATSEHLYAGVTWSRFIRAMRAIELQESEHEYTYGERTGVRWKALVSVVERQKDPPQDIERFLNTADDSQILWSRPAGKYYDPEGSVARKSRNYLLNLHHPRVQVALLKAPVNKKPLSPAAATKVAKP